MRTNGARGCTPSARHPSTILATTLAMIPVWMLAVAVVGSPRAASAQTDPSVESYVEAVRAYHLGEVKRALSHFETALKRDPGNAEMQDVVARVYQEYAYKAHRRGDDVRSVRLLELGMDHTRTGETRLSLRRDYLRVSYLRIVARIKAADLYSALSDEDILFQKVQRWLATDDSVYVVLRRLHEHVGGLPEAADVWADDRMEDVHVVLEGLEWQPSISVAIAFARFAILGYEHMLGRVFIDEAKRLDADGALEEAIKPLDRQLRARSVPVIIQSNAADFTLVLESTETDIRWRGTFAAKPGDREVRVAILPGAYRMRCVKPGYGGLTMVLQLPPGSAGVMDKCLLAAESRSITIDSPVSGERVRIEGVTEDFAEVPFAVQLRPGDYMALVERVEGDDTRILKVGFTVRGDEDRVVLNTTYGEIQLHCLGAPCDKGDFRVQTFKDGWLGPEVILVHKEADGYLLPFGTYKITLIKSGYAPEEHTVDIGPGDLDPEVFTLRATSRGAEEEAAMRAAAAEAALPSLFRYHHRLRVGAGMTGVRMAVERADGRDVERSLKRVDTVLDYVYRFKLAGKRIPFVFFNGRFGLQVSGESQKLSDLLGFEATIGGGLYQRFRANIHAAFSAGYHIRFDEWSPDDRHLSAVGFELRGLVDLVWFRQKMWARFDYGRGRVQIDEGNTFSTNQTQSLHVGAETAIDLIEAIVGEPLVDLYLGVAYGGDYVRERIDSTSRLSTYDRFFANVFLHFEWRLDIAEVLRWAIGVEGRYHILGPYSPELFMASQDKADAGPGEGEGWSAMAWIGMEF